jgi:hypothetical protein
MIVFLSGEKWLSPPVAADKRSILSIVKRKRELQQL